MGERGPCAVLCPVCSGGQGNPDKVFTKSVLGVPPEVCSSHLCPAQRVLCEVGKWFLVNHFPHGLEKGDCCSGNRSVSFILAAS